MILYIAVMEEKNDERNFISYLSRGGCREQILAYREDVPRLIFPIKKLRHYLLAHQNHAHIQSIKYIMTRSALSGNLVKRAVLLKEFHILYAPSDQTLADFLAAHPVPDP